MVVVLDEPVTRTGSRILSGVSSLTLPKSPCAVTWTDCTGWSV